MFYKLIFKLVAASLTLWAIGCSDNPIETEAVDPVQAEEFGGYTATDEAPAFGDAELVAVEGEEQEIDDPILTSPAVQEVVSTALAGAYVAGDKLSARIRRTAGASASAWQDAAALVECVDT